MYKPIRRVAFRLLLPGLVALLPACDILSPDDDLNNDYEVWLVDQSDSPNLAYGGTVYIYDQEVVQGAATPTAGLASSKIDLGGATSALCLQKTGANPVRPHMLLFNSEHSHAILAFVASGHVVIFDAETRAPLDCIRTSESPTTRTRQAHAAFPSPDGSYVIVANQNGKRLERIDTNFATNSFVHRPEATIDLATCTTPSGAACEAPGIRPLNWPICPVIDASSRYVYITLRGGGLLVADAKETPMKIVAEYDVATVKGNGCGGAQVGNSMYINSGGSPVNVSGAGGTSHPMLYGFDVYRFPTTFAASNPANSPAPQLLMTKTGPSDSHGVAATRDQNHLWVFDRFANVAEVINTQTGAHVSTVQLAGALSSDPSPDLVDISPDGELFFVALRGPTALTGDPHNSRGETPGLGVITIDADGRNGELSAVHRITNVGTDGVERADAHAIRVRLK